MRDIHIPKIALNAIFCQGEIARRASLFAPIASDTCGMETNCKLGEAIDRLRRDRGLSKKALAHATNIDEGNLNRIISGRQAPTPARLKALTTFFGVKHWELYYLAEEGALYGPENPRKAALKTLIDALPDDKLDAALRGIDVLPKPTATPRLPAPQAVPDQARHAS